MRAKDVFIHTSYCIIAVHWFPWHSFAVTWTSTLHLKCGNGEQAYDSLPRKGKTRQTQGAGFLVWYLSTTGINMRMSNSRLSFYLFQRRQNMRNRLKSYDTELYWPQTQKRHPKQLATTFATAGLTISGFKAQAHRPRPVGALRPQQKEAELHRKLRML